MEEKSIQEVRSLIAQEFELEPSESLEDEENLLRDLTEQVAYMLDNRAETLFSTMYRLDISEKKIRAALHPSTPIPPAQGIAQLIIDRQKMRLWTKKNIQSPKLEDWDDGIFKSD